MRTDSIYSKLERHDAKAGTTYFLDLMIFIQEAEGDKFGKAADLVKNTWKFPTSKTSLCDGYDAARSLWLIGRARSFADSAQSLSQLDAATKAVIGQRSFQIMADPTTDPAVALGFAKLEVQKMQAEANLRRVKILEENTAKASAKLQELRDPKNANDEATRQAIIDRVDELMGIKRK